jgi:hypothetical protein
MEPQARPPITDSPWFWVMMFSLMALGALVAIGGKYGQRQSAIERQYQARERVAEQQAAGNNLTGIERSVAEDPARREFASPGSTLVPLWPLAVLLVFVALLAVVMLLRGPTSRRGDRCPRPGSLRREHSS